MNKIWFELFKTALTVNNYNIEESSRLATKTLEFLHNKFGLLDPAYNPEINSTVLSSKEKELCNTIDALEKEIQSLKEQIVDELYEENNPSNGFEEEVEEVPVRHAVCSESYRYPCLICKQPNLLTIDEYKGCLPCNDCHDKGIWTSKAYDKLQKQLRETHRTKLLEKTDIIFDEGDNDWDE